MPFQAVATIETPPSVGFSNLELLFSSSVEFKHDLRVVGRYGAARYILETLFTLGARTPQSFYFGQPSSMNHVLDVKSQCRTSGHDSIE